MTTRRPRAVRALVALTALGVTATGTAISLAAPKTQPEPTPARTVPFQLVDDRDVDDRLAQPEDRYAVAGGCYTLQTDSGYVARDGSSLTLTQNPDEALPLHFQPTRLGEYLLATDEGRDPTHDGAWWDLRNFVAAGASPLTPAPALATELSESAEWRLTAEGDNPDAEAESGQRYVLSQAKGEQALAVQNGQLVLADAATPLTLHLTSGQTEQPGDCAVWPEIRTGASGDPQRVKGNPAGEVQGFFEAHVHGMAFEFLGGELRCGRPWHPYGVEYALGNCYEENNYFNGLLEVPLGGYGPDYTAAYDPVGWPTFHSWPRNRTLTHEQFYWRWLERAYAGGLRLMTNLLVDNTALCQAFPVKKNSCNEMDGVRLQAQRLFELQDYIDAQNGGPGEGWLRIVTSPAQARETINAGRLAVVLGIETSELFDCREILDQPQCTPQQIDERLQEVFDMGVRQMELVNKFDNALSGVTGDNGATGVVVNTGNRHVTGHYWDMRTCENDGHIHTHGVEGKATDRTQPSITDASPGDGEGIDALAGRILNEFGGVTKGFVAPAYGPGPHCNSRGLTPLGEHLIRAMVAKGMIFDPDHMSAEAQQQALDLIEDELAPAERKQARREYRPAVQPAVISSHSWANDVVYQRIYALHGLVAPRTDDAAAFVDSWLEHRDFAARNAPKGYAFGMGYGADTNGLGGQPPARPEGSPKPLDYAVPFPAPIGGVTLTQQESGLRKFDINTEGVSHYGLFADWFRELQLAAEAKQPGLGEQIIDEMLYGAESYLQLWERAVYGGGECVQDHSTFQHEDLHALLGLNVEGFLQAIGQPVDRDGAAYVYCVEGEDGAVVPVEVTFDDAGRAAEIVANPALAPAVLPASSTATDSTPDSADNSATADGAATTATNAPLPAAQTADPAPAHDHAVHDHAVHDDAAHEHAATSGSGPDGENVTAVLTSGPGGVAVGAVALAALALLVTLFAPRRPNESRPQAD